MKMITKCEKEIARAKNQLLHGEMVENFGHNEVRKIKDKYDDCSYSEENQKIKKMINAFNEWCMNVTYKDLLR